LSLADFLESTKIEGEIFASITLGWGSFSFYIIIAITKLNLFPSLLYEVEVNFKAEKFTIPFSSEILDYPLIPISIKWKLLMSFVAALTA
jgi:hypothetical protein